MARSTPTEETEPMTCASCDSPVERRDAPAATPAAVREFECRHCGAAGAITATGRKIGPLFTGRRKRDPAEVRV